MLSATLQSESDGGRRRNPEPIAPDDQTGRFIAALSSGGDSRIATNPCTGLNKYLCPEVPAPEVTCLSSCTASPISIAGFERAKAAFHDVVAASSPGQRVQRLAALSEQIEARLLRYFDVGALARIILCPSGTDAMLTTAMLIAAARPGETLTAILPSASETGTGVPMAARCRVFDGPDIGRPLTDCAVNTREIPLRALDGSPLCEDEVSDAFAAASGETGKSIIYLTYGTKTGLIAPVSPPPDANVIVDACQARIAPATIAMYLRQGWPVVVTGSKFFGGAAFSGAVLFPRTRLPVSSQRKLPSSECDTVRFGMALRWTAAIAEIDAFEAVAADAANVLSAGAAVVEHALTSNPVLVPIRGPRPTGSEWAGTPSIFTFGVRNSIGHGRLLSAAELRPIYERLARMGVLLGQPVGLGLFGGLRIAIGARDLADRSLDTRLAHAFGSLEEAITSSCRFGGNH